MSEVIKADVERSEYALEYAVRLIHSGKVVAFPTDTFYGLGADPFNLAAVSEIFRIKRRSYDRPLPLLVSSLDQAADLTADPPAVFFSLAKRFWPGPLTIIVPASRLIPLKVTGNTGRVALRWPDFPFAVSLIRAAGRPLTGTSANLTEHPACATAQEVESQIGDTVPLILDAGATPGEMASTIVDAGDKVRIMRHGPVSEQDLKEFLD
ncbi:MAG TPA: L-threonylcarbamoyladenylate synthase [Candidatus Sulfopaludibacter sp.]|nr:L-threonylcarbamoyladenylate synthase [Terriglobia bacterium]HEV2445665.1 L-threonylcarbamoyladenylate synthase [Candidatus Sulfopaludibacter sp.]